MRSRRWIALVALLGVLLHAGAIVRHHGVMLGATLQYHTLVTELAQICHSAGTTAEAPSADLPAIPKPSDAQSGCPICSGLGSAVALATPEFTGIVLSPPMLAVFQADPIAVPQLPHAIHPPARGPPALA